MDGSPRLQRSQFMTPGHLHDNPGSFPGAQHSRLSGSLSRPILPLGRCLYLRGLVLFLQGRWVFFVFVFFNREGMSLAPGSWVLVAEWKGVSLRLGIPRGLTRILFGGEIVDVCQGQRIFLEGQPVFSAPKYLSLLKKFFSCEI